VVLSIFCSKWNVWTVSSTVKGEGLQVGSFFEPEKGDHEEMLWSKREAQCPV